jgi:cystinosin
MHQMHVELPCRVSFQSNLDCTTLVRGPTRMLAIRHALFRTEARSVATTFALVALIGVPLGFAFPPEDPTYPQPWRTVSGVVGWIYFTAWSISFYPQVFINHSRKSVVGLSFEYPVLNLLGFCCYSVYNAALFWNPSVRAAYARAHDGALPSVQSNDVFFGLHAVLLTCVILWQIGAYDKGDQKVARWCWLVLAALLVSIAAAAAVVAASPAALSWLDFIVFLSYVKLAITLMKYTPQAVLNYRRQATVGWRCVRALRNFFPRCT